MQLDVCDILIIQCLSLFVMINFQCYLLQEIIRCVFKNLLSCSNVFYGIGLSVYPSVSLSIYALAISSKYVLNVLKIIHEFQINNSMYCTENCVHGSCTETHDSFRCITTTYRRKFLEVYFNIFTLL